MRCTLIHIHIQHIYIHLTMLCEISCIFLSNDIHFYSFARSTNFFNLFQRFLRQWKEIINHRNRMSSYLHFL